MSLAAYANVQVGFMPEISSETASGLTCERSAREKREWAQRLLSEKRAIIVRKRREIQIAAEERRSDQLLDAALRYFQTR